MSYYSKINIILETLFNTRFTLLTQLIIRHEFILSYYLRYILLKSSAAPRARLSGLHFLSKSNKHNKYINKDLRKSSIINTSAQLITDKLISA